METHQKVSLIVIGAGITGLSDIVESPIRKSVSGFPSGAGTAARGLGAAHPAAHNATASPRLEMATILLELRVPLLVFM